MKRPLLPFCLLLLSVPAVAQTLQSFTPAPAAGIQTYANAEVVRVDGAGRATVRTESGDAVMTADLRALAGIPRVRTGDKLLIAFETVVDDAGRERQVLTYARPASATSGQAGPAFASTGAGQTGSVVRVISTNRANRTITVSDLSGEPV